MSEIVPDTTDRRQAQRLLSRVFRRFTGVLARMEDMQAFSQGIEALVREFPDMEEACIHAVARGLGPEPVKDFIDRRSLALPLQGVEALQGILSVPDPRKGRKLGPEDLHLLSAIGSLVGVLLERGGAYRNAARENAINEHLLNLMPLGVVCHDPDGTVIRINNRAREFLHLEAGAVDSPYLNLLFKSAGQSSRAFHMKVEDSLLYAQSLRYPETGESPDIWITLLYDLSRERNRVMEFLLRETYHCQWKTSPLSLLTVQAPVAESQLMARLPALEQALEHRGLVGPVDAQTLAVVIPNQPATEILNWLRRNEEVLPPLDLKISLVDLADFHEADGTELFENALQALENRRPFLSYRILVVDDYEPVLDTVDMVLGNVYQVRKARSRAEAMTALRERPPDLLILVRELRGDPGASETIWEAAGARNPLLRTILTSADEWEIPPPHGAGVLLLEKPFDAGRLRSAVKAALE